MSKPKSLEPEAAAKPKGKKRGLLLVIVGVVVLAGAGGGGFFWWRTQQAEAATTHGEVEHAEAAAEVEASVSGALSFDPFVVNLTDSGGSRYLKADIRLLVSGAESIEELSEDEVTMLRLGSAILEHLSYQTAEALVTPEGKESLKAAIAERSSEILTHAKVVDVLFNEFVVQF